MTDEQLELDLEWEQIKFKEVKVVEFKLNKLPPNEELPRRFPSSGFIIDMKTFGQDDPIWIGDTEEGLVVVDGNKRVKAMRELGWDKCLALIRKMGYRQAIIMRARLNNVRSDNDLSDILAIQEILEAFPTTFNVNLAVFYTGMTHQRVKSLMKMAKLDPALHDAVIKGWITETTLNAISKVPGAERKAIDTIADKLLVEYEFTDGQYISKKTGRVLSRPPILFTEDDVKNIQRVRKANAVENLDLGLRIETKLQGYTAIDKEGNFLLGQLEDDQGAVKRAMGRKRAWKMALVKEI